MQKTCRQCGMTKDLARFNKKAEARDGHAPTCKDCRRIKRQSQPGVSMPDMSLENRKLVYNSAIIRMAQRGLTSRKPTEEMLDRVGEM